MSILKKITLCVIVLLSTTHTVMAQTFPRGCEVKGFTFQDNFVIFNDEGKQSFYMVQNRSEMQIEMVRHETKDVFMSPLLRATFAPQNWSALATDVPSQYFRCYKVIDENSQLINCQDVLDVCQYPRARFALSNMGNYWVSVDKNQYDVIKDAVAKGIYLKW